MVWHLVSRWIVKCFMCEIYRSWHVGEICLLLCFILEMCFKIDKLFMQLIKCNGTFMNLHGEAKVLVVFIKTIDRGSSMWDLHCLLDIIEHNKLIGCDFCMLHVVCDWLSAFVEKMKILLQLCESPFKGFGISVC